MVILSHDPPKTRGQPPVHRAPRERSAAAPAVCGYSMRRFLPTAGASSASGTKTYLVRRTYMHDYGTCQSRARVPVRAVDARFLRSSHLGGRLRAAERVHRLPEDHTWRQDRQSQQSHGIGCGCIKRRRRRRR